MVCVLLIVVGVANLWCWVLWVPIEGYGLATEGGRIAVALRMFDPRYAWYPVGLTIGEPLALEFWPPLGIAGGTGELIISVPIWVPLLVIGITTILAFRLDRRPIPGHCPCGYDLTGNVSGTCPECGRGTE